MADAARIYSEKNEFFFIDAMSCQFGCLGQDEHYMQIINHACLRCLDTLLHMDGELSDALWWNERALVKRTQLVMKFFGHTEDIRSTLVRRYAAKKNRVQHSVLVSESDRIIQPRGLGHNTPLHNFDGEIDFCEIDGDVGWTFFWKDGISYFQVVPEFGRHVPMRLWALLWLGCEQGRAVPTSHITETDVVAVMQETDRCLGFLSTTLPQVLAEILYWAIRKNPNKAAVTYMVIAQKNGAVIRNEAHILSVLRAMEADAKAFELWEKTYGWQDRLRRGVADTHW